jgi:hypothetical protein
MSLLSIESAKAYVTEYFAGRAHILSAEMVDDGGLVVVVKGEGAECGVFTFDVWEEPARDGSTFLYGEY